VTSPPTSKGVKWLRGAARRRRERARMKFATVNTRRGSEVGSGEGRSCCSNLLALVRRSAGLAVGSPANCAGAYGVTRQDGIIGSARRKLTV